ncbi:hypothetical protein BAJUN_00940 [Bajunvirus bajun]|uniref:Uncharacterized protein n=1 Tax=Brevundimonas phage vB_BgoS-Bajun TaxID=2948594 RepID=A0A9E7N4Q0_9CAUD|nr:hypothetical protein BAJUN_00940 [Brevundimonas phage vB_BgoS-Bajun]
MKTRIILEIEVDADALEVEAYAGLGLREIKSDLYRVLAEPFGSEDVSKVTLKMEPI